MEREVEYGTQRINFTVHFSHRKTLAIDVHPDRSVRVVAPEKTDIEEVEKRVRRRARWILRQQRRFSSLVAERVEKEYVSGESFRYLGRQYRLKVVEFDGRGGGREKAKLRGGFLYVYTGPEKDRKRIEKLVRGWYRAHAECKFKERFELCCDRVRKYGIQSPPVQLREMRRRWGSCTPGNRILLNPRLIHAPTYCIDCVILHELCHLKHRNHSKAFFRLLEAVFPEWEKVKKRLGQVQECGDWKKIRC